MANRPEDKASRGATPPPAEEPLERRPDNIGQSGRWRAEDGTENDEVARHYGKEERWHSTDEQLTPGEEPPLREPNRDKPNASSCERPSAPREEGAQHGDDQSRYRNQSYAEAGGKISGDQPKAPGERWQEKGGAGHGENYGVGRDAEEGDGSNPRGKS
jgi:hypothetical protein